MYANNDRFVHELSSLDADIRNRFDLLPDGYISVFSDTTIFANSGFLGLVQDFFGTGTPISQQLERLIPFNQQFGPSKGARLDVTNRRLVLRKRELGWCRRVLPQTPHQQDSVFQIITV